MAKLIKVNVADAELLLYFSVAGLLKLAERFGEKGTIAAIWAAIVPKDENELLTAEVQQNVLTVAAELIVGGAEYQRVNGEDVQRTYTAETLAAIINVPEYFTLYGAVVAALQQGLYRTVESEPDQKKAETTQGI